jgi:hypothetical protein
VEDLPHASPWQQQQVIPRQLEAQLDLHHYLNLPNNS